MATHRATNSQAPLATALPSRRAQYGDNLAVALRTTGAALIGNSALIYFGFMGSHADKVWIALTLGVFFIAIGCVPINLLERDRLAERVAADAAQDNAAKGA